MVFLGVDVGGSESRSAWLSAGAALAAALHRREQPPSTWVRHVAR